jgi:WD40 repeat protein
LASFFGSTVEIWDSQRAVASAIGGSAVQREANVSGAAKLKAFRTHEKGVTCMDWSPFHSNVLLTGGRDLNAHVWDLRTPDRCGFFIVVVVVVVF